MRRASDADAATINFLSQSFPNPFLGTAPIYTPNISRASLLRPWPQFTRVTVEEPAGYSWYHALQTQVEKRCSHGYTVQLSYTWSKAMQATEFLNAADAPPYQSIADLERTHHLVITGMWDLGSALRTRETPRQYDAESCRFPARRLAVERSLHRQSGPPLGFGDVRTLFTGTPNDLVLPKTSAVRTTDST